MNNVEKLLKHLRHADGVCLDNATARDILDEPDLSLLLQTIEDACQTEPPLAERWCDHPPPPTLHANLHQGQFAGVRLTAVGRKHLHLPPVI